MCRIKMNKNKNNFDHGIPSERKSQSFQVNSTLGMKISHFLIGTFKMLTVEYRDLGESCQFHEKSPKTCILPPPYF
jgi:hypothetical protein